MSFELWPIDNVVRLAAAGGGFTFDARMKSTDDLVRIAAAAGRSGAQVVFSGIAGVRSVDELVRIAAAGKGSVTFGEIAQVQG